MKVSDKILSFLNEINRVCNNEINIKKSSIRDKNNYFLYKIELSNSFKEVNIKRIERLYNSYKDNDYEKKVILDDITNLFYNQWDGAYSELLAYDLMNLISHKPCKIQISDLNINKTLAKECKNKNVSAIDGYCHNGLIFLRLKH